MRLIGFPIPQKENENRRALLPCDVRRVNHPGQLVFEKGYGEVPGFDDDDYLKAGARIASHDETLSQPVICDPKIGDAPYLKDLESQTVFGWVHAVANRDITDVLIERKLTAYAWEDMFVKGRHIFWRNNEIAGEAAVFHAFMIHGVFPYATKVAILGRGNIARGALKTLNFMGADVRVYDRHTEQLLRDELGEYDVVVNAILWDKMRKDHIISRADLARMKKGAMIIDIACDRAGAVETAIPTSIEDPTYFVDGIRHYVVDHTPALFYKSTSASLSTELPPYLNALIYEENKALLEEALIVKDGIVIDQRINDFQNR